MQEVDFGAVQSDMQGYLVLKLPSFSYGMCQGSFGSCDLILGLLYIFSLVSLQHMHT